MKEDFVKLSDIDMVKLFRREEGQKTRQVLRDTLFARFYEQFGLYCQSKWPSSMEGYLSPTISKRYRIV